MTYIDLLFRWGLLANFAIITHLFLINWDVSEFIFFSFDTWNE